jgi:hypothetical protein
VKTGKTRGNMTGKLKGGKLALIMAGLLLAGVTTVLASEGAVKLSLANLYDLVTADGAKAALDTLNVQLLESDKADSVKTAANIFNTGVYEQGFDNTLIRDVMPLEAESRIISEKLLQSQEPVMRETDLHKAIQSLLMLREQQLLDEKLLVLTREEADIAKSRHAAGLMSEADWTDSVAAVEFALLDLGRVDIIVEQAELEVMNQAGTSFDAELTYPETGSATLLETKFEEAAGLQEWLSEAEKSDVGIFDKSESLRFLNMKLEIAKKFIPDTHVRVIEMLRDREYAILALAGAESGIELNLRNLLNDRITAIEQLELAYKGLDLAKRHRVQDAIRQEAGLIGRSDIIPRERDVLRAEYGIVSAIAAVNMIEADLRALVGIHGLVQ